MRKVLPIISFFLLSLSANAQISDERVLEARKILIQGMDSIGEIVQIDGMHSYVFLKDCHQSLDSTGLWHTDFEFGNPNRIIAYNITIILQLNHFAESIIFDTDGVAKHKKTTHAPDNSGASYSAAELSANGTITATIISQKKIFATITGAERPASLAIYEDCYVASHKNLRDKSSPMPPYRVNPQVGRAFGYSGPMNRYIRLKVDAQVETRIKTPYLTALIPLMSSAKMLHPLTKLNKS